MTELEKAARQALEALEFDGFTPEDQTHRAYTTKAITALRRALEQPTCKRPLQVEQPARQEPVAWPCVIAETDFEQDTITLEMQCSDYMVAAGQHWLSTTRPPAREPLTGEQIQYAFRTNSVMVDNGNAYMVAGKRAINIARAIEAAHGIGEKK